MADVCNEDSLTYRPWNLKNGAKRTDSTQLSQALQNRSRSVMIDSNG